MHNGLKLEGERFGRLTVISQHNERSKAGKLRWVCRCDCGKTCIAVGGSLKTGNTKSCGCIKTERVVEMGRSKGVHKLSGTRIYNRWRSMIRRCHDPKHIDYPEWGGRGIYVCERWRASVLNFIADMGEPQKGETLDRINNNGPYCPENCRWADANEQSNNRRNSVLVTYKGQTFPVRVWAKRIGVTPVTIRKRLRMNLSIEQVLKAKKTTKTTI